MTNTVISIYFPATFQLSVNILLAFQTDTDH